MKPLYEWLQDEKKYDWYQAVLINIAYSYEINMPEEIKKDVQDWREYQRKYSLYN